MWVVSGRLTEVLIGVFLGPNPPSGLAPPPYVDFGGAAKDLPVLEPLLQQPFFIGSGITSGGTRKTFVIPDGASRLFLAVMDDSSCNSDNTGSFQVSVTAIGAPPASPANPVLVPAIADVALAGQLRGVTNAKGCGLDSSPLDSGVKAQGLVVPGQALQFSASGNVDTSGNTPPATPPDGEGTWYRITTASSGFGIGSIRAPYGALIGVFLGPDPPSVPAPPDVDFSGGARDLPQLSPLLQQPFFVGSGLTSSGTRKSFVPPSGAARLFLAVMDDASCNSDNTGSFQVTVSGLADAGVSQPGLRLPLPGGKHWLLSTEAGTPVPTNVCPSGLGGKFYGGGYDCLHSGNSKYALDFVDNNQEEGHLSAVDVDILAAGDGTVDTVTINPGQHIGCNCFGNFVVIKHANNFATTYGHLKDGSITVSQGQQVTQGQRIAVMGTSGDSTGIHIHFETRYNNQGATQPTVLDQAVLDGTRIIDYKVGTTTMPTYYLSTNSLGASQPAVFLGGVVNAASFAPGAPVVPGSIASVFGTNLASSTVTAATLPLPSTLAGTSALFGGYAVPFFYVSPGQMNIQVPWQLAGQSQASLTITATTQTSAPQTVNLATYGPGIFQFPSGQGIILIANTAIFAAPAGSISGAQSRPANPGEYLVIYATGLGPVTNQPPTGSPASLSSLSPTTAMPTVTIGGVSAPVLWAGLAPGFVGLYQVNVQTPPNAPTGDAVLVVLSMGGTTSNAVSIAVAATAVPATPTNPSPGSTTSPGPTTASTTVTLSWSASSGATYYGLAVRDMATGTLVVDTNVSATSYTATLSAGKQYRWNVSACNSAGCSSYTTALYFQIPGAPGLSLQGKMFAVDGTLNLSGKALRFEIQAVPNNDGTHFLAVDDNLAILSGIQFQFGLNARASISGNTATFNGPTTIGLYMDQTDPFHPVLASIDSATLTINFTSLSAGSAATGTVTLVTSIGTLKGDFTGTLTAIV